MGAMINEPVAPLDTMRAILAAVNTFAGCRSARHPRVINGHFWLTPDEYDTVMAALPPQTFTYEAAVSAGHRISMPISKLHLWEQVIDHQDGRSLYHASTGLFFSDLEALGLPWRQMVADSFNPQSATLATIDMSDPDDTVT